MEEQNQQPKETSEAELCLEIDCFREKILESLAGKDGTWQDLNQLSLIAISEADWYLDQKEYRTFGLYLQLYADIWQYAYSHLNLRDYQYFCHSQEMPDGVN